MAKKKKCECPKPGLTAPFYMMTYGDLMTLLLCFFVLLFAMSTVETIKFQAQVSVMQGAMGIAKNYKHAPMQQHLPAPSVKQSTTESTRVDVTKSEEKTTSKDEPVEKVKQSQNSSKKKLQTIKALGISEDLTIEQEEDDIIIVLPSYGIFNKGEYEINPMSIEVQRVKKLYTELSKQISELPGYDVYFVGHTDSLPLHRKKDEVGPKNNIELGFLRAKSVYDYFFSKELRDKTSIVFASQGDNVPLIRNAALDSELRKNRRIQIHLKKKKQKI